MNNVQLMKLIPAFEKYSKKINPPEDFDSLMIILEENYKNDDPNKIYRIIDKKTNKLIRNQNDYESLILENFTEKEIKLSINLIDKPPEFQEESNHICFKSNIIIPPKVELSEEEKIKQNIREMVQSKMKLLEQSILEEISKKENPIIIHKGISCSNCGMKEIVGIRYKCTTCPNFNLCENCEENIDHDDNHVLLKIKEPILSEKNLEQKINDSIIIQDYKAQPSVFNFKRANLVNVQTVTLINDTNIIWNKKTCFTCVREKSSLIGNDITLEEEVEPGSYINVELIYDMENANQNQYFTAYKLIDEKKQQIGKIHIFKIIIN